MNMPPHSCCSGNDQPSLSSPLIRRPFIVWSLGMGLLYGVSFGVPFLKIWRGEFEHYFMKMLLPMMSGLFIGGVIDHYIPREYISKYLARKSKRTVFYAAGLGFLMSACSHGIAALSMELHKKGASGPAVISFLLASPWANLPITFLLVGFFGTYGFLIIVLALLISLLTGLFFQALDQKGWIEKNAYSVMVAEDFSIFKDLQKRFHAYRFSAQEIRGVFKGIADLADMVFVWLIIGMLLASLAAAYVPAHLFGSFFGPTLAGLGMTLLAATIIEVCSEGTSALAFEIYSKTGAFGNAFAFLMGGVVTDYTEIGLVWKNLGRKTALWMLVITLPQVFIVGMVLNLLVK